MADPRQVNPYAQPRLPPYDPTKPFPRDGSKSAKDRWGIHVDHFRPDYILRPTEQGNLAKELIKPGDEVKDLLMRTNLKDENDAIDVGLLLAKYQRFNMEQQAHTLLYKLAALTSINGLGRKEYSQVATGIISPSLWGIRDGNKKNKGDNSNE